MAKAEKDTYSFSLDGSTPTPLHFSKFEDFFIRIAMLIVKRKIRKEERKRIVNGVVDKVQQKVDNVVPIWEPDPRD